MEIRIATSQLDYEGIMAIDSVVWDGTNTPVPMPIWSDANEFKQEMDDQQRQFGIAVEDDVVLGYVEFSTPKLAAGQHKWSLGLAVAPFAQGQGIGTALLEWIKGQARLAGKHKLVLRVLGTNPGAMRLYKEAGFKEVAHLKDEFLIDGHFVDDYMMAWFVKN